MNIVAPAGNMERFYAAVKGGAHEIFMGLKGFGARRNAENFTMEEFKQAIDYAHKRGVKILLTLNTLMMDTEIEALYSNLKALYEYGLDAVIVQDLGFAWFVKQNFPELEIHGSTQMTVANHIEAEYLKKLGFSRVVLPRELSFEEIKNIKEKCNIELEIFVSGALCISYSGNCYMSSFIGARSGNRGMCAQPCRKFYKSEEGEQGYLLSPKDQLYSYEEIKKLQQIGVECIKVEGRMKDPHYVFETVNYYKDLISGNDRVERTSKIFNRGYSKGYFSKKNKEKIMNPKYPASLGEEIGQLTGRELKLFDKVISGDGFTYLSNKYEKLGGGYLNRIEIKGKKDGVKVAEKNEVIILRDLPAGTKYIFRSYAKELNDEIENVLKKTENRIPVEMEFKGIVGEKPTVKFITKNNFGKILEVEISGEIILEAATKHGVTEKELLNKFSELGETTFYLNIGRITLEGNPFVPASLIKSLKRDAAEKLTELLIGSYRRKSNEEKIIKILPKEISEKKLVISAIVKNSKQEAILKKLGIEKIYHAGYDVAREGNLEKIDLNEKLASNLYQLLENKSKKVTLNWNMNIGNRYSFYVLSAIENLDTVILSPEISFEKIKNIGETKLKKGILIYGKPRGMYIELSLFKKDREIIENEQGDKFIVLKNPLGNSEIYLEKSLNIIKNISQLEKLGIDEGILEFTTENEEEIKEIIGQLKNGANFYRSYNYEKGVY
jgi:putative protease